MKYFALLIRPFPVGQPVWRFYRRKDLDHAYDAAEAKADCLEVIRHHEITEEQYMNGLKNTGQRQRVRAPGAAFVGKPRTA